MFTLEGKLTFINIDQGYLKKLHNACSEVYYKPSGYENKPYIGILINKHDRKYVIPLSSAKEKHKTWKNVDKECYLVYEIAKKLIPIVDGVYSRVNINPEDTDTNDIKKYKDLLNKEYSFCLKVIDEVIGKANKLYDKQMATGKVVKFCCDFKALEEVADK